MLFLLMLLVGTTPADTVQLTLNKAIDYGLKHNPEIQQLQIDAKKIGLKVNDAIAAYYPSLSMGGYFAYLSDVPVLDFGGTPIPMGQHENYSVSISLNQVLFAWGKLYDAYKIAGIQSEIAELKLKRKEQEIRYAITDVFYGLLVLEKMVHVSKKSLSELEKHKEAVVKRYRAGLVPQYEVLRSGSQTANMKQQLIKMENAQNLSKEGFKLLLGMDLDLEFTIKGALETREETYDIDELTNEAMNNRIELRNMKNFERIAEIARDIARKIILPAIVAGATYERKKPFSFGGDDWGSNLTFNVGFQFNIFSGFKTRYQYEQALLILREAELANENLTKAIQVEVKQAFLNLGAAKEGITAAGENVDLAEKAFSIIEKRYSNGLVSNLEYLDTQLSQIQAETGYLSALKNYYSARAALYKAIGKTSYEGQDD